jgi:hypothetical protein
VATDVEVFYTHMLIVYFYFCRLTFLVHILHHIRTHIHIPPSVTARGANAFSSSKFTRTGCGFALTCSRDALTSAEALLTAILSIKDKELLATAPDSVHAMISFAAGYITTSKFLVRQSKTVRSIPGVSDELIARTIKCLQQVSLSADDNASRCARVISGFVDTWHEQLNAHSSHTTNEKLVEPGHPPEAGSSMFSASKTTCNDMSESSLVEPSPEPIALYDGFDYMFNLNLDQLEVLLGPEFWQNFAEMPTDNINPICESHLR